MANDNGKKQNGNQIDIGKLAAGGFAVVAAAIALVGGATGAASRFLRNNSGAVIWSVILSLIAVGMALLASQIDLTQSDSGGSRDQRWHYLKHGLVIMSFLAFGAASIVTVHALTDSLSSSDRPRITATWTTLGEEPVLSVTVQISGMSTSDTLNVSVRPVQTRGNKLGPAILTSQTGADAAGDGDVTFAAPLPPQYNALQIVANLGIAAVTCDGKSLLTPATPTPTPIPSGETPVPVSPAPNNKPVFSCVTISAPITVPTPSPTATKSTRPASSSSILRSQG